MGHKVILNRQPSNGFDSAGILVSEEGAQVSYSFEYSPDHTLTPQQSGQQFAKIQRLLEKAVLIAGDHEHEE